MNRDMLVLNDQLTKQIFSRFLLPSIFALMASNLSSMIDTVIVGNYLGDKGLAAMSLVTPVYLVYFTFGSMIAVGASIRASMSLGENNLKKAEEYFGFTFMAAIILGVVFTILGQIFLNQIVWLLGADGELYAYARDYCFYYIMGGMITLLFYIPFNFLKIMGKPKTSMSLLITMGSVNVCLTLLFVGRFHMGCGGAALATIISLGAAFLLGCRYMFAKDTNLKLRRPHLNIKEIMAAAFSGSSSAFNNLSRAVTVILINYIIARIGTNLMLTVYTVSRSVNDLFLTVVLGISQSIVPLVSLFFGEKDNFSIRIVIKYALRIGTAIIAVCAVIVIACANPLMHLFGIEDVEALGRTGIIAIICVACSLNISFINNLFSSYYSAVDKSGISNAIMLARTFLLAACAFALGSVFGADVIWGCYIAAEIMTLLCWNIIAAAYHKRHQKLSAIWLLDKRNEDVRKRIAFSVKNTKEDIMFASEKVTEFCDTLEDAAGQALMVSLAIEEILLLISSKCFDRQQEQYMDLCIYKMPDALVLRIRSGGRHFNPIAYFKETEKEDGPLLSDAMGMGIILKKAKVVDYKEVLGINNLLVML